MVSVTEGTELVAELSPDGRWVAFILLGEVWLVDGSGGQAVRLTNSITEPHETQAIAWAQDSRRLAVSTHLAERPGIRVIDIHSRDTRLVHEGQEMFDPEWSPSGEAITAIEIMGDSTLLWSVPAEETGTRVRAATLPRPAANLAYAPDGQVMAYSGPVSTSTRRPTRRSDLWERDLATGIERQLTADTTMDAYPAYSPDGRWIAFLSERSGSLQVWILPRGEGEARSLTQDAEDVYLAPVSWLPDARGVAYTAAGKILVAHLDDVADTRVEFVADLDVAYWRGLRRPEIPEPGERRRVRGIVTPQLSPDGKRVAFSALGDLWVASLDGDGPRRLTRTPEYEAWPRWSPDGTRLAFSVLQRQNSLALTARGQTIDREVRVLDIEQPDDARAIPLPATDMHLEFVWSPDGQRLAYLSGRSVGWTELESGETRVVANTSGVPIMASLLGWSPGGDTIVFSTGALPRAMRLGRRDRQIWRAAADSGVVAEWAVPGDYSLRAAWTPSLSRAAYAVGGVGHYVDVDGSAEPVRIPDPDPRFFSWSADGRSLLYLSGDQLRLLDIEGGEARSIDVAPEYVVPFPPEALLVRNARIIDGTGTAPSPPVDLLVDGGRIRKIAAPGTISTPDGAREIDAEGRTVLPGLFNTHAHYNEGRRPSAAHLYYGVLATRDVGWDTEWMQSERERVEAGELLAPRLFMTGGLVVNDVGFNTTNQRAVDAGEQASIEGAVGNMAAVGADVIKPYYRNPVLDARVSDAAHAQGLPMTSHFLFPGTLARGLEGKEHSDLYYRGWTAIYRDDVLSILRAAGTCVTLTLVTYPLYRLAGRSQVFPLDSTLFEDPALSVLFSPGVLDNQRWLLGRSLSDRAIATWDERFQWDLENAWRLHDAGVRIATGTDLPAPADELAIHLEMELLVKAGLTPLEAIRAATLDSAACLGVEDRLGSVEVGKLADFIIVDGDPATEIRDSRRIVWVVLSGRLYSRQDILDSFSRND